MSAEADGAAVRSGGDSLARGLLRGGAVALGIKVGAAGLSFLTFLVLARVTSLEDFGRIGFGVSLAGALGVVGSYGQRALVLRYAPAYASDGDARRRRGLLRFGYAAVAAGCGALGAALVAFDLFWPGLETRGPIAMAGLLTLALGVAEYQVYALRSLAGLVLSQAPRDLLWRLLAIAAAAPFLLDGARRLSATEALGLLALALVVVTVLQAALHPATRPRELLRARGTWESSEWTRVSRTLWGVSVVNVAGPNSTVVVAGLLLSPEATGMLFAAMRLAALLDLIPMAAQMAISKIISRMWHENDRDGVARVYAIAAAIAAGPALLGVAGFALLGRWLLSLFGAEFAEAWPLLMILSVGFLVKALAGPAVLILQFAGREGRLMRAIGVANLSSMALVVAATPAYGALGAAAASALGPAASALWALRLSRTSLGIDTSILAPLRRRLRRAAP